MLLALARLRYTIGVEGRSKKILSISLQKKGDLILDLKPSIFARLEPHRLERAGKIEFDRSSIHPSLNSLDGNTITRKTSFKDKSAHFTRAIKTTNSFAPVILRFFPDLSFPEWPVSDSPKDINIGTYDPKISTLITGVFVGPRQRHFLLRDDAFKAWGLSCNQNKIGSFNVVVLWRAVEIPSTEHGFTQTVQTHFPGTLLAPEQTAINEKIINGFDESETLEYLFNAELYFRSHSLAMNDPEVSEALEYIKRQNAANFSGAAPPQPLP